MRKLTSGSSSSSSRKRLYEHTLMQRKVKTYLLNMPVIDSEPELDRLSLECEPQAAPAPGSGSAPPRRRIPSPSPSSLSSQSNQSADQKQRMSGPKFGTALLYLALSPVSRWLLNVWFRCGVTTGRPENAGTRAKFESQTTTSEARSECAKPAAAGNCEEARSATGKAGSIVQHSVDDC